MRSPYRVAQLNAEEGLALAREEIARLEARVKELEAEDSRLRARVKELQDAIPSPEHLRDIADSVSDPAKRLQLDQVADDCQLALPGPDAQPDMFAAAPEKDAKKWPR